MSKRKIKQLPLTWNNQPEQQSAAQTKTSDLDAWAGWWLIDDDLPPEVLQAVNDLVAAAWSSYAAGREAL